MPKLYESTGITIIIESPVTDPKKLRKMLIFEKASDTKNTKKSIKILIIIQ